MKCRQSFHSKVSALDIKSIVIKSLSGMRSRHDQDNDIFDVPISVPGKDTTGTSVLEVAWHGF